MGFKIISPVTQEELIARGTGLKKPTREALNRRYGSGSWRKMKGQARVCLDNGGIHRAEVHWYEANGIGRRDYKIKKILD